MASLLALGGFVLPRCDCHFDGFKPSRIAYSVEPPLILKRYNFGTDVRGSEGVSRHSF